MALGVLTLVNQQASQGPIFSDRVTLVGAASYTTGGDTGLAAALQVLTKDKRTIFSVVEEDSGGDRVVYLQATDAVKVYDKATGVEKAGASSQAGVTYKLRIDSR